MKKYVEIWNVEKTYDTPRGPAVIVRDFNLTMQKGEFVSLIGHSGCGKSTLRGPIAASSSSRHASFPG